jgi:hydrogenase nickel incorporation protein HypA/HybF
VIGQLASIVDDSVQFYWEIISKDTLAEGAKLHFRRIETEMNCRDCNTRYKPAASNMSCPSCGSSNIKIIAGEEFFLESINVEK